MEKVEKSVDVGELVQLVDPSSKGIIVFSYLCEILQKEPELKNYFKGS